MLDRALYIRYIYWKNEQNDRARQGEFDSVNNDDNYKHRLRSADRGSRPSQQPASDEPAEPGTVKTKRGNLPVVAVWDGSSGSSGLSVLKNIKMLPPVED